VTEAPGSLLIFAALVFVLFVVAQIARPRGQDGEGRAAAKKRHGEAVSAGTDERRSAAERAASLARAGRIALDELHRPRLAARHAEWAHRLAPSSPEVIAIAADAMTAARRFHALERLLWASAAADAEGRAALDALIALYRGPMKLPTRAQALERWRRGASDGAPTVQSGPERS
jgi:hypothetical protein